MTIAIVGGTGPQGSGIGLRLALAGEEVILGSRDADKARAEADRLTAEHSPEGRLSGTGNAEAAERAETVILAVPYRGHDELVTALAPVLAGKLVISCVNPLSFDKLGPVGAEIPDKSAAEEAARILTASTVAGAFHHLSAVTLHWVDHDLSHEDVLVCGDDTAAKAEVMRLAGKVTGGRAIDVGALRLARHLEPFTAVLISVNKRYKTNASVSLTGIRKE
ncbi:NADPH-dependent F420 reductase [Leucobacter luti]|uniref:Reduced coenzyme F420:NADP oxidoreductase n=1 Tax=Leucobacter luti TaxID=340320 RepID=A0A4Q7U315_9MICO|nr:NADPH-dependent F420 reductase [Leucobacter luti]MBL3699490.1 NADPH-dependent F420 reductase [Leucobacter luti]RZT67000.1 reduced coenzyme F420:NADP oxidoreductase [Leucobacter luti]